MSENLVMNGPSEPLESFEVTKGGVSGDLLSARRGIQALKVGFFACGYFEYWRMYPDLGEQVAADMKQIADHLSSKHNIRYPGFVDTLDKADLAGQYFKNEQIDLLVISEGTYCPDYFVHQALLHIPRETPLIIFSSQVHRELNFETGYDQSLRNSGPMALVQLTGGFRKMGLFEKYEVVVGTIDDDEAYEEIGRIIQVHTTIHNLKHNIRGFIAIRATGTTQYDQLWRGTYKVHRIGLSRCDGYAASGLRSGPHQAGNDLIDTGTARNSICGRGLCIDRNNGVSRVDSGLAGSDTAAVEPDFLRNANALTILIEYDHCELAVAAGRHCSLRQYGDLIF